MANSTRCTPAVTSMRNRRWTPPAAHGVPLAGPVPATRSGPADPDLRRTAGGPSAVAAWTSSETVETRVQSCPRRHQSRPITSAMRPTSSAYSVRRAASVRAGIDDKVRKDHPAHGEHPTRGAQHLRLFAASSERSVLTSLTCPPKPVEQHSSHLRKNCDTQDDQQRR